MNGFDLVAFGDVLVDEYFALDEPPRPGAKQCATFLGGWAGGMAGNVAAAAAEQGLRCAVVAGVGDDRDGEALVDELAARSIDIRWMRRGGAPTGRTIVGLLPGGERLVLVAAGGHAEPPLDALGEVVASRPRMIYTAALSLESAARVAAAGSAAGIDVAVDVEEHEARRAPDLARRLAGACAVVACGEETARLLGPRAAGPSAPRRSSRTVPAARGPSRRAVSSPHATTAQAPASLRAKIGRAHV